MIEHKKAIEALRSGVPNRDAVRSLGTTQPHIEQAFMNNLDAVERGERPGGFLIRGGFGAGKSHLLEYLQHRAEERGFVTSRIIIGKQTPLHDPAKVFRAALESAHVPGKRGEAMEVITGTLKHGSPLYGDFRQWVNDPRSGLNDRFAASLYLSENLQDAEFSQVIHRFWGGETIRIGELRKKLKLCGDTSTYMFPKVLARDLAIQRFRFFSRMIRAAGYKGWVLLFDEGEIVAQYSLLQRGRSYAEIARWVRSLGDPIDGATAVLAITNEFASVVLDQKQDADDVPNKLRQKGDYDTAEMAEIGMELIKRPLDLAPVDDQTIDLVYQKLRRTHGEAYAWSPPDVEGVTRMSTRQMREYVRGWIHAWDLKRLYPDYDPDIGVEEVDTRLTEDEDIEGEQSAEWEDVGA